MTTTTQPRRSTAHRPAHTPGRIGRRPALALAASAVGVLTLLALVIGAVTSDPEKVAAGTEQVRPVTVTGAALPPFQPGVSDPAVGQTAPAVAGAGFTGAPVTMGAAGEPQLIFFVAHWCPHCQAEVPVVTEWLKNKGLPEGVRLVSVSTATGADQPNYPPSAWLEGEAWPLSVLADNGDGATAQAYGLTGLPFFVAIGADGRVVARASGELPVEGLEAMVSAARNGVPGPVADAISAG